MATHDEPRSEPNQHRALRGLLAVAAVMFIISGLDEAEEILQPVLFGGFLAITVLPMVRGLQRIGVPDLIAIPLVVVVSAGALVGLTSIFAGTVRQFTVNIVAYEDAFTDLVDRGIFLMEWVGFSDFGAFLKTGEFSELLTPPAIMKLVTQTVNGVVGVLGRVVIVVVTMSFILLEASDIERKLEVAFGTDNQPAGPFANAGEKITRYLLIKTIVSAITGVAAGLLCRVVGLDFWVMWGVIAFILNYIPTIGSILAAIPALLLSLVQLSWEGTVAIAIGYTVINISLGNFIEPRLMGQSLGLSPLVVFLSLVFWGWLWGPVGMLLCVPLTVMAKLILESNDDTRWIAVLLGSHREARRGGPPIRAPSQAAK